MKGTIDRIEDDVAVVLTDRGVLQLKRSALSPEAREGDVVDLDTGEVDVEATERARAEIEAARERARRNRGPSGSFDL